ncbi:MAG: C25 family cysteine peptidase, partial [Candidatus Thermoplasmatota archaeon]
ILHAKDFDIKIDYVLPEKIESLAKYDFLIISPDAWLNELEALKQHKESKGIKTIVVGLNEIYNSPASRKGRDDAEKVKYFIKNAIEEWGIKYVLLVGDGKNLPYRLSYIPSEDYETSFPSDLYFADIYFPNGSFSSWDTNNNDKFGEYKYQGNTDLVDLAPDVYIGRVACSNSDDVKNIVNKIINYENIAIEFQDWFRNLIVCGGDTFTPDDGDKSGVYEGEYLNSIVLNKMKDFNGIKLWASLQNLDASTINSFIINGAGFVDFSGHGNKLEWATHPPLDGRKWIEYRIAHVLQTTNKEKLPVVIINACSCGRFDSGDCFAWKFLDHQNGGGIASLAASGIGYGTFGTYSSKAFLGWMEVNFFNYYKQGKKVIGDIWASSINGYISAIPKKEDADYKTIEEWMLFGDPTLRIGSYTGDEVFVYIDKPLAGYLYIGDNEIMKTIFGRTIIFGGITIEARAYNAERVEFYIDNYLKYSDDSAPYLWKFDEPCFGRHQIKVVAYGKEIKEAKISVFIFNI